LSLGRFVFWGAFPAELDVHRSRFRTRVRTVYPSHTDVISITQPPTVPR